MALTHATSQSPGNHDLQPEPESAPAPTPTSPPAPPRRARSPLRRLATVALGLIAAAGAAYAVWSYPEDARRAWESVSGQGKAKPRVVRAESSPTAPTAPWDGTITLPPASQTAIGVATIKTLPQTAPIRLELLGTTDYITDTLTKIRPMFKGRVDKVHVTVSQAVKKGDPLVDLYSKDLAEAKSEYEIEQIQWIYDRNLLKSREPLLKSNAISQVLFEETRNNEMKTRREYEVSRDKLFVLGLTAAEIEKVADQAGSEKARMTLRSPINGFVIERDVVPGNLYDENDTLFVIAPLEHLWVWGNVFESDLDLVKLGQDWEIRFPFLEEKLHGKVEYISNRVDSNTHAVRIRTSIPNLHGRLKSAMLVRGMLEIPPVAGRTVIPRTALIVDDGHNYVFVRKADAADKFERRLVGVAQEKDDHVVIEHGLKAGDEVVSVGGLILAQIFEDLTTAQTGAPAAHAAGVD